MFGIEIVVYCDDVVVWFVLLYDLWIVFVVEVEWMVLCVFGGSCEVLFVVYVVWCVGELYLMGCVLIIDGKCVLMVEECGVVVIVVDVFVFGCVVFDEFEV